MLIIDICFRKLTGDRHSIFRMPFKSKLSLSRHSSREENQVTTIQQAVSASTFPPNRAQDYATVQKNENLKRLIHERLQSRYSNSMPTLNNQQDLNPKQYRERSVDEVPHSSIQQERKQDYVNEAKHENHANQALPKIEFPLESSDKNQVSEEIFQKRVKFEEVSEIEETVFEAQFENDIVERSTNSVANIESEKSTTPPPTPYYVQEFDDIDLPPKPMKRKSRENSFNTPSTAFQNSHIEEENETTEPTITENELRLSAPPVKPRTKRLAHRTSDIEKDEVDSFLVIQTLQEEIKISVEQDFFNVDKKLTEKLETIENHENDVVFEVEPREVQAGPKSILKSSETSSTQKTITFHNTPLSIPYNETSSSSSSSYASYESDEEEDVWSRVNIHRYHLNRHNDVPPPLPKTPPPSEQDEKQISFA